MAVTIARFLECLNSTSALSTEELAKVQSAYPPDTRSQDADELARGLVQQGKLTRYQAAAIFQGKSDSLVLGNYLLLDKLGAGGMGQVFRARHRRMDRVVALKVLPKKALASPDAVARFQREVKAAAKLTHPNIVTAHDADEANGVHFLVMEYVDGNDLASLVKKAGPLPVAKALSMTAGAARGLQHAHAEGVVHRDIKPANLIVDKKGQVKILDMGLARLDEGCVVDDASATPQGNDLTQAGTVNGTVDYMAPEQGLDMHAVTDRADIYSLGCTLFFLLTGKTPYTGDSMVRRLLAHRDSPIPSIRAVRPEVPEPVDKLFQRMMAKRPEDRPTATELISLLEGKPGAPAPVALPNATSKQPASTPRTTLASEPPRRKSPVLLVAGGSFAVVLALGIAYVVMSGGDGESKPTEIAANDQSQASVVAAKQAIAPTTTSKPKIVDELPTGDTLPATAASPAMVPKETEAATTSPIPRPETSKPQAPANESKANPPSSPPNSVTPPPSSVPAPPSAPQLALTPPPADAAPTPTAKFDPAVERRMAEWAISMGGRVEFLIDGQKPTIVTSLDQLPTPQFTVLAIEVPRNRKVNNDSLKPLLELNRLSRLVVSDTSIDDGAFAYIVKMPWLTTLGVADTKITDAGIDVLAAHPKLEVLNASNTALTDRALQSLARNKQLRFIHVNRTKITDAGLLYLNELPQLLGISVGEGKVTDRGVKNLEPNADLTHLALSGLSLTDTSVDILSRRTILKQLILRDTNVTDRSVEKLTGMTSLLELSVASTQISLAGFEKLKSALPTCRLDWSPPKPASSVASDAPAAQRLIPIDTASRAPIPANSDQEKALQVLKDVFRDGYTAAKKPEEKAALASQLFKQAGETRDDATSAYVMLTEARNLAIDAADAAMLVRVAQELAGRFEMSPWNALAESLESATQKSHPLPAFKSIAEAALGRIDEALDDDQFDAAKRLGDVALAAARKSKDAATLKAAVDRNKSLAALKQQWDAVEDAKATLANKPDDPEANLTLGRYLCFVKGDWVAGFAKLVQGSDATLKELATKSMADPQDGAGQAEIGETWAKAADAAKGKAKSELQAGARYWYAKALPVLTGLAKAKAEQRIKQLGPDESVASRATPSSARPIRRGAVSPMEQLARDRKGAEWVLGRRGKVGILYPGLSKEQEIERVVDLPQHPFGLVKVESATTGRA
ncbi:MAG: protein kinase, partial [Planctomycetes bacterium]|nr:protein kinase [Planctomycetota bacterium]